MKALKILLLALCMTQNGFTEEEIPEDYKINFLLPINWTEEVKYNLMVTIPEGFKPLQPISAEANLFEFIPKNEDENDWSEIITVNKFVGQGISAIDLVDHLKTSMLSQVENSKSWKESSQDSQEYQESGLGLSYDLNGRREVVGAEYFSGPFDCVGVQYTIRSDDPEVTDKIDQFFEDNVQVISE